MDEARTRGYTKEWLEKRCEASLADGTEEEIEEQAALMREGAKGEEASYYMRHIFYMDARCFLLCQCHPLKEFALK